MKKSALVEYLRLDDGPYYGKLQELHAEITGWLSYIPQTFPHFTRHTVEHSEQIILQASQLLFEDNNVSKPVLRLSPVEAYALCAAAYLHDAGMVSSDEEKAEILASNDWAAWLTDTPYASRRWSQIEHLRSNTSVGDEVRNFLADVELCRLLADYLRRIHHERSARLARVSESALGRFGFGDDELISTISALCRGHGLGRVVRREPHKFHDCRSFPLAGKQNGRGV